jgi:hypothetical protein
VNSFIYFGIGIIAALLMLFAFSQTSTFRDWLREKVVITVNGSINGELSIERIDGTVFTALIFNNIALVQRRDTLLFAEKIELRTSPLKILFKTIYIRKIELTNADIDFLKDETGELNIFKLLKQSDEDEIEDSVSSEFTFKIEVADLSLNNVDFNLQSFENKNNTGVYENLNTDDLRLKNINLSLNAFADISGKEIRLSINGFSVKPNLRGLEVKNLTGDFLINNEEAIVSELNLKTKRSNILLNLSAKDFPLFGGDIQIEKVPLRLELNTNEFNFDDLTNFVPVIELLQGSIKTNIRTRGTLKELNILNLDIALNETRLRGRGSVKNVTDGDRMLIDVNFLESYIKPADPDSLLRTIDIPVYDDYGNLKFDTLYFKGEPLKFNAGVKVETSRGEFDAIVSMDLTQKEMVYDISLNTQSLDLSPIINLPTSLNSHIVVKGKGTSPESMKNHVSVIGNWSEIQNRNYQKLFFDLNASRGDIIYDLSFKSDTSTGDVSGKINFADLPNPVYNINASLRNFNIANLIPGSELETDLNINIAADGNYFDPDSIELFAVLALDSSKVGDIELSNKKVIVDLRNDHRGGRVINVVSNLADITLSGQFSILDIGSLITAEVSLITDFIDHGIEKINPTEIALSSSQSEYLQLPEHMVDINYSIEFKDFELLSLLLGNIDMEIDGDISGFIKRNDDSLLVSALLDVNYFKYLEEGELYFISGMNLSTEVINDFSVEFPSSFTSNIDLSVHDLFLNEKIHDLNLIAEINHRNATLDLSGQLDNYLTTQLNGSIVLNDNITTLLLDSLFITYNNFDLWNKEKINITYSNEQFIFNEFTMTHNPGDIELNGLFSLTNDQSLSLNIKNLSGKDVSRDVFKVSPETGFDSNIDLTAFWQGTAASPLLNLNLNVDDISIKKRKIGTLITSLNYDKSGLDVKLNFLDTLYNIKNPKLKIDGVLPIDLSLQKSELNEYGKELHLSLEANEFELVTLSGLIPFIKELNGKFIGKINVDGTMEDLNLSGKAAIHDVSFTPKLNNIMYEAFASVLLENDDIIIDSLYIQNTEGTIGGGTIVGGGKITHSNLEIAKIFFNANGQLKVLAKETQAAVPTIYGDLSITTRGDIVYIYDDNENSLSAEILINKGANVTIAPARSGFSSSTDGFIYKYKIYSSAYDDNALIDSLIVLSDLISKHEDSKPSRPNNLNLQIKIGIEDEAKIVFVLSPEFKQNLTAYLGGNFEYTIVNNNPVARGELNLLQGSKLEFIKPFDASGSVKFFDELDNPYLDVTATYQDYYLISDTVGVTSGEKEVEIRIRLEGPLSDINKNFSQQEGNIYVYVRDNNLGDYQLDATKTSSDAIMFIIVGKFTDDATNQDRNVAASTAASFAGSLVGSFLNQEFGDYIRSVRFQQVGSETKFSLIGKADISKLEFRYEFGGTSQVFQDLTRANVKIETSPITSLRNLILRFQRRDPLQGSSTYGEMINEFGIKYRFDF